MQFFLEECAKDEARRNRGCGEARRSSSPRFQRRELGRLSVVRDQGSEKDGGLRFVVPISQNRDVGQLPPGLIPKNRNIPEIPRFGFALCLPLLVSYVIDSNILIKFDFRSSWLFLGKQLLHICVCY
jgi:hypothetical protein